MVIYPAIDLLDGSCVRLRQGDYDAVTRFDGDPVAVARDFVARGARALHVVDLEGARRGTPAHGGLVRAIDAAVEVPVQVGGGIREFSDVEAYLKSGLHRVLVGTAAVADTGWLREAVRRFGAERVAAAVDVRDGEVMLDGWRAGSGLGLEEVVAMLREEGFETFLYTDTRRDGMLASVDVQGTRRLAAAGCRVIAAGGVTTVADVRALRAAGAAGAVIGSALYRGRITLSEAITAAEARPAGGSAGEHTC